jgi:hypothetical protein
LAAGLEAQLGIPSLSLTVRPPGKSVSPSVPLIRELLRALDGCEGADLLERLVRVRREHPGDLLYAALAALQVLADDNARVRSRTGVESLQDIVGRLRERAGQPPQLPTLGERLAAAWVRRDNFSANSLLWQVEVVDTGLYGPALVGVALILQAVIVDTADARGEPPATVFRRLGDRIGCFIAKGGET